MNNTQKKFLMLVFLVFGCIITSFITDLVYEPKDKEIGMKPLEETVKAADKITTIRIYVSGAVVKPGLYDVPRDARADDAVKIAGGFNEHADSERVNLARKLKDGAQVNVPTKKLRTTMDKGSVIKYEAITSKNTTQLISLNINTASVSELQQLPGIGPAMAQRIVAAREESKFSSIDGLLRVKGIGKAKLERIKTYVRAE